jgi:UDP:flavonoid glycosyltransferase YjiC (YdhE family)
MRVLFSVSDYSAHYFPMVPLGWALQAAGHEVRVACAPSEVATLTRAGLTPAPVLGGPDMMERGRIFYYFAAKTGGPGPLGMPLHPVTGKVLTSFDEFDFTAYKRDNRDRNIGAVRASMDAAVELARDWRPDLIVHDVLSLEGVLAAQVTGVPAACHLWGAIGTAETEAGVTLVPQDHNRDFERYKVGPMSPDLIRYVIDPCPPAIAPPTNAIRLPVRYVPYNGAGAGPEVSLPPADRPRICVIWGNSIAGLLGPKSFLVPTILDGLADLDVEVVVACQPEAAAQLGPVPDNARILGYAPLKALLPDCAAVVYHGGAGCGMTAVTTATPHLALPFTPEQSAHAHRLAAAGVGIVHDGRTVTPDEIGASMRKLLADDAYRVAAANLRAENNRLPAPAQLVENLEKLAAG